MSHKNAIKSEFFKNWGQIGLSDPLTFGARAAPVSDTADTFDIKHDLTEMSDDDDDGDESDKHI